ncbi:jg3703 [Pararge aegeria aegeria]|uniref:Jg3703 protein n=1 Tax=Pararge aegeria aegeria TaxID=348720 RepID=A0A8S4S2J6_9NEOP|nr:jg3703 [Pararge aegeria aegeria]
MADAIRMDACLTALRTDLVRGTTNKKKITPHVLRSISIYSRRLDGRIKSAVGGPLHECTRLSASREKWRMLVGRVTSALKDAS